MALVIAIVGAIALSKCTDRAEAQETTEAKPTSKFSTIKEIDSELTFDSVKLVKCTNNPISVTLPDNLSSMFDLKKEYGDSRLPELYKSATDKMKLAQDKDDYIIIPKGAGYTEYNNLSVYHWVLKTDNNTTPIMHIVIKESSTITILNITCNKCEYIIQSAYQYSTEQPIS